MTRDLRRRDCIASAGDVQTSRGRAVYETSFPGWRKHVGRTTCQARRAFHLQSVNGPAKAIRYSDAA